MVRSQIAAVALATSLVAPPSLLRAQVSSQLLAQARTQIAHHRLDSAGVLLKTVADDARADSSGRAEAFLWLGVVAFYTGHDSSATESFREALRHDVLLVGAPVLANLDSTLADTWEGEQTKAVCGEMLPAWGWPPDAGASAMNRQARAAAQGPEITSGPELWYPDRLRNASIQGRVLVRAIVDASGRAEKGSVRILTTPNDGFNDSVLDYMRNARFRPATVDGGHVRSCVVVPIDFKITRRSESCAEGRMATVTNPLPVDVDVHFMDTAGSSTFLGVARSSTTTQFDVPAASLGRVYVSLSDRGPYASSRELQRVRIQESCRRR